MSHPVGWGRVTSPSSTPCVDQPRYQCRYQSGRSQPGDRVQCAESQGVPPAEDVKFVVVSGSPGAWPLPPGVVSVCRSRQFVVGCRSSRVRHRSSPTATVAAAPSGPAPPAAGPAASMTVEALVEHPSAPVQNIVIQPAGPSLPESRKRQRSSDKQSSAAAGSDIRVSSHQPAAVFRLGREGVPLPTSTSP